MKQTTPWQKSCPTCVPSAASISTFLAAPAATGHAADDEPHTRADLNNDAYDTSRNKSRVVTASIVKVVIVVSIGWPVKKKNRLND